METTTQKIAVLVVHGIGEQKADFAVPFARMLRRALPQEVNANVLIESVYWAPALQREEDLLRVRLSKGGKFAYQSLRNFMINFAADAIAYQPAGGERQAYAEVHQIYALALRKLADEAGPDAPLVIVAHSLGTVITSNYLYDLMQDPEKGVIPALAKSVMEDTPLERGETLALLYTCGSPIALWSLRYENFGLPITFPHQHFAEHYPRIVARWVNMYDKDDIIGYPLKTLNAAYDAMISEDREVNVGGLFSFWNPLSHLEYLTDRDVVKPIASAIALLWQGLQKK